MADPLSIAASICGIASLAETVVSKGYKYIKAVKDCREDVSRLLLEVNVLCGVLERLGRMLEEDEDDEDENQISRNISGIPSYVLVCQKTLNEVLRVLNGFERKAVIANQGTGRKKKSFLTCLSKNDLKWPLSKESTMALIESLERHKATCILALSANEHSLLESILASATDTNKHLQQIRKDQNAFAESVKTQENTRIFQWLSPVNPQLKHRVFREDYQEGTCLWVFDLPEYKAWAAEDNTALFVYGIPGAGKTTLASLIIDTLLVQRPAGFAFFYCRHDDQATHDGTNVLGSLMVQLAMQHPSAYSDVLEFYKLHHPDGRLSTQPNEAQLVSGIMSMSQYFQEITLVIDGLDECGTPISRARLLTALSRIHKSRTTSSGNTQDTNIRLMVLGRAEPDIRETLDEFSSISIAAKSSDLQLFVAAHLSTIKTKSMDLREDIVTTLTQEANGMFQWVKLQVDYLSRLPNDRERRKALRSLPPDLPATYVRILEDIDSRYPEQTRVYIRRALKWLILHQSLSDQNAHVTVTAEHRLTRSALCHAISIEPDTTTLDKDAIPMEAEVTNWLSSLVKHDKKQQDPLFQLSHFTVKEFLLSSPDAVPDKVASYLVNQNIDPSYLAETCIGYLSMDDIPHAGVQSKAARAELERQYPLYGHAAIQAYAYLYYYDIARPEPPAFKRFFSSLPSLGFSLWNLFCSTSFPDWSRYSYSDYQGKTQKSEMAWAISPLQFAAASLLPSTCARLLTENANPNGRLEGIATPLHFAISKCRAPVFTLPPHEAFFSERLERKETLARRLDTIRLLVTHGADLGLACKFRSSHLMRNKDGSTHGDLDMSPLCVALACYQSEACDLLLELGASLEPSPAGLGRYYGTFETIVRSSSNWNDLKVTPPPHKTRRDIVITKISAHIESNKKKQLSSELESRSDHDVGQSIIQEKTNLDSYTSNLIQPDDIDVCVEAQATPKQLCRICQSDSIHLRLPRQSEESETDILMGGFFPKSSLTKSAPLSATAYTELVTGPFGTIGNTLASHTLKFPVPCTTNLPPPEETLSPVRHSKTLEDRNTDLTLALATRDIELVIQRINFHRKEPRQSQSPIFVAHLFKRPDIVEYLHKNGISLYAREVFQIYSEDADLAKKLLGSIENHPISVSRAQLLSALTSFLDNESFPKSKEMDYILNSASTDHSFLLARMTSLVDRHKENLRTSIKAPGTFKTKLGRLKFRSMRTS